ncbi:MAG: retropepsin-like aspartic protease, partial [Candidatus Phytoplasma australasiaticum]|nr:retropepsin-like aspartic protease [Candidatus Phytoplasma australasiaticum]
MNAVRPAGCFECGSLDHFIKDFPNKNGVNQPPHIGNRIQGNPGNPAWPRDYLLGDGKVQKDPNTVEGTFSLNNHYVTVLFDSGADVSFISLECAPFLDKEPVRLSHTFEIEVANGKTLTA